MPDNPKLLITDLSKTPGAMAWREEKERIRAQVRRRYLDYLAGVFTDHGVTDAGEMAEMAIEALFDWRSVATGDRCECGCHPRLADGDLHDGGFGCGCTKTAEQRRRAREQRWADIAAFWNSPEGQHIQQQEAAEEAELQSWLATQPDVVITSHGRAYPEQWEGSVDGHSFYFRERWGDWRIELDLRPNGHIGRVVTGVDDNGEIATEEFEHSSGEVIAEGTTFTEGYGENLTQRAQFIVGVIRIHLARQTCLHHGADAAALRDVLGEEMRWCPACGAHLAAGVTT
ncbi:hypothetical protein [Mycobacterium paraintracellulare]|uniref:hypothetical protein n=1 Tax=Mycobacterium paraintracellulare TaxID=1138383 RepID=UPI001F1B9CED|nr:hypothetical protein [Mycobacterium paraintracellulare]